MAVVGDDEKPRFRCLDAARYAVAFMVAAIVLVVTVRAVVTVLRPADLIVRLDRGHVSVTKEPPDTLSFKFTVEALNPSGRVRIYFTDILANISKSLTEKDFFVTRVRGLLVEQQDAAEATIIAAPTHILPADDFNQLSRGLPIGNATLKLSGIRTVETYAGHNDTAKRVIYYCQSITVGGEEPEETPPDVPCTEQLPAGQW